LTFADAIAYVRHRLKVAGGNEELFSRNAVSFFYERGGGIPRVMNQLCDMALVYAFAEGLGKIDADLLVTVLRDRAASSVGPITENA